MDAYTPSPKHADYVSHKLGTSPDSFYGGLVRLLPHADGNNRAILRAAYPRLVRAFEAWEASPDGEFEVPDVEDAPGVAACGCTIMPGASWTTGHARAHFGHTTQAMLMWLLLHRRNPTMDDLDLGSHVSVRFSQFLEAVAARFPEAAPSPTDQAVRP